ncbi:MAG: alpha/beta fold hydrolase [Actinobacteria bacterium]|nr:alpha/beta fold hydrolase [Actinomycetota bacterium]
MLKRYFIYLVAFIAFIAIGVSLPLLSCKEDSTGEVQDSGQAEVSEISETAESVVAEDTTQVTETTAPLETTLQEETVQPEETIANGGVTFLTEDSVELNGNIFGQGRKWVILLHMYPTDQTSWFDFAEELARKGYVALTLDFRGYGNSGGNKDDIAKIDKDVMAAINFIKDNYNYDKIFLLGASMGGTAAIVTASEISDSIITGVITLAAPDKMGSDMDALSVVSKLKMPKLFISAKGDDYHAESAQKLYDSASEPKDIEIIENSMEHGTFIFEKEPQNSEKLKEIILNFLDSN